MYFEDPAGSKTGKLFPTGNKRDMFDVPDYGKIEVTVLDCSNHYGIYPGEGSGNSGNGARRVKRRTKL